MSTPTPVVVGTPISGLAWAADPDGRLRQLAVGADVSSARPDLPLALFPAAYPTVGDGDPFRAPPFVVTHAGGRTTTRLRVAEVVETEESAGVVHTTVTTRDEVEDLTVELHARSFAEFDVVEQWVEVRHEQGGAVTLHDVDSFCLHLLAAPEAEVVQFGGSGWADEWAWTTERLTAGTKLYDSFGGVQPHLQRAPVLVVSPDGPSTETEGTVLALSLAWGGNCRFAADVRPLGGQVGRSLRLRAGANWSGAPYVLDPGVTFRTPSVLWTWSDAGRGPVSDRFHRWTRAHALRHPGRERAIVANNWEATFFDFDEQRLLGLVDRAAEVGAELFLLDDGWFGDRYPRDDDTQGLGDWTVDRRKLPRGLSPVADAARAVGLRFGIWVEPEMVNPRSEHYEAHPERVVRDPDRVPLEHRQQLVLDPLRPDVATFVERTVADAIAAAPGTTYVKWDANRPVTDPGSSALPADRQSNLWIDHVWSTWARMAAVADAHPDVDLMLCASGGGRVDHGSLRWFDEFWTSDNTDPVTRVLMQWGCSLAFPAEAMAAHVTRWGERPLPFACAVALWGRYGIDLDLAGLGPDDLAVLRRASALAKHIRPVVHAGRVHRLVSPTEGPDAGARAAVSYVSPGGDRAVLLAYELDGGDRAAPPDLVLRGLDPDRRYDVVAWSLTDDSAAVGTGEPTAVASGTGEGGTIAWPLTEPLTAAVWEITATGGAG